MVLSLNCLILGQASDNCFTVDIGEKNHDDSDFEVEFSDFKVSHFKEKLFREQIIKDKIRDKNEMNLWKVDSKKTNEEENNLKEFTISDIREKLGGELMNPRFLLGKYFNENSFKDEESKSAIHIIVVPIPTTTTGKCLPIFYPRTKIISLFCFLYIMY